MSMQTETSDKAMLDFMRREGAVTISGLVDEMGVTATAVRQRLQRLDGRRPDRSGTRSERVAADRTIVIR